MLPLLIEKSFSLSFLRQDSAKERQKVQDLNKRLDNLTEQLDLVEQRVYRIETVLDCTDTDSVFNLYQSLVEVRDQMQGSLCLMPAEDIEDFLESVSLGEQGNKIIKIKLEKTEKDNER